jgi:ParB/RepB/Spo0J family partition protein
MALPERKKRDKIPISSVNAKRLAGSDSVDHLTKPTGPSSDGINSTDDHRDRILSSIGAHLSWPPEPGEYLPYCPLSKIITKDQPRKRIIDSTCLELADSALINAATGHIQYENPIICHYDSKEDKLIVRHGHRRLRGATLRDWAGLDVLVRSELKDLDNSSAQIKDNINREDMSHWDISCELQKFSDNHGLTTDEIALIMKRSKAWVSAYMGLNSMPEYIREFAQASIAGDASVYSALKQLHDLDPKKCRDLVRTATAKERISRKEVKSIVDRAKTKQEPVKQKMEYASYYPITNESIGQFSKALTMIKQSADKDALIVVEGADGTKMILAGYRIDKNSDGTESVVFNMEPKTS